MRWADFQILKQVLDHGGFGGAAAHSDISHATVRRRIARLEGRLGATLFTHSPDGLAPTAAAQALRPTLDRLAGAASLFDRLASGPVAGLEGAVRVVAEPIYALDLLAPLWADLRGARGRVGLDIAIGADSDWPQVLSGRADIAVTVSRADEPRLDERLAGRLGTGLFAHRRYLEEAGLPREAADLRRFAFIGAVESDTFLRALRGSGLEAADLDFVFRSDSRHARLAAVREGVGVGLYPIFLAARDPGLVWLLPHLTNAFDIHVVTRRDMADVRRVALIRDALIAEIGKLAEAEAAAARSAQM